MFECHLCDKVYKDNSGVNRHIRHNHKENIVKSLCDICKREFKSKDHLREHLKVHENGTYKCDFCPEIFKVKSYLKRHTRDWHLKERNKCDICGKEVLNLWFHNRRHKKDLKVLHSCDLCKKKFTEKSNLSRHRKTHESTNILTCPHCLRNYSDLKKHLRTHDSNRKFDCDKCDKSYLNRSTLILHSRIHADFQETFPCDMCEKIYKTKETLRFHMRMIHEESF